MAHPLTHVAAAAQRLAAHAAALPIALAAAAPPGLGAAAAAEVAGHGAGGAVVWVADVRTPGGNRIVLMCYVGEQRWRCLLKLQVCEGGKS